MTWNRVAEGLDDFYRKHMPRVLGGEVPSLLWLGVAYCAIFVLALILSLLLPAASTEQSAQHGCPVPKELPR